MHASRRRGKSRQKILYWFRSPPNVKVGRAALDEEAIRWIEEHNPDVKFDWPKILEVGPPATAPAAETRQGRRQGGRTDGRERRAETRPTELVGEAQAPEAIEQTEIQQIEQDIADQESASALVEPPELVVETPPVEVALTKILSREQLMSVRARFAELQARITERAGSAERMEALRARAEGLNPDTWVTEEDVRRGMADFEPQVRDLRAALGLRRRRRSRRGGRRHRRAGAAAQPQSPAGPTSDTLGEIQPDSNEAPPKTDT